MKIRLPACLALALLSLLTACSTPGTTASARTGPSGGSRAGGMIKAQLKEFAEIPFAILSIPGDILGNPSTMSALSQAVDSHQRSSAMIDHAAHSSGGSGYQTASTRSSSGADDYEDGTGISPRLRGEESAASQAAAEEDDGLLTPRQAVAAFEKSEMDKVEAFRRAMLGGSSSSGAGSGGRMTAPETQAARHSRRVPAGSNNEWVHVGDFDGIRVWWKHFRELKDQVESALKMENLNSHTVTISYQPWFIAADGTDYQESGGRCTMRPGATKTGNTGGLFFYVKDAQRRSADPPRSGGVLNMLVTPQG